MAGPAADIEQIAEAIRRRGLRMNPCLLESEVVALENQWGITLPREYRDFVTRIGNGGIGPPDYGLDPLGTGPRDDTFWNFPENYSERLRRPFRETSALLWEEDVPDNVTDGLLYLGNDGCGMYWTLVVTGAERGQVWQVSEGGVQPCAPNLTFFEWYEAWLDGNTDWWRDYQP